MSGEATAKPSLREPLMDECGAPLGVVGRGAEGGGGDDEISRGRGDGGSDWRSRGGGDGG